MKGVVKKKIERMLLNLKTYKFELEFLNFGMQS